MGRQRVRHDLATEQQDNDLLWGDLAENHHLWFRHLTVAYWVATGKQLTELVLKTSQRRTVWHSDYWCGLWGFSPSHCALRFPKALRFLKAVDKQVLTSVVESHYMPSTSKCIIFFMRLPDANYTFILQLHLYLPIICMNNITHQERITPSAPWPLLQPRSVRRNADWNGPPWQATMVTMCMSYFTTGGPVKEHGTNKPPPTGSVWERSKGDATRPNNLPESSSLESILAEWGARHQEGPWVRIKNNWPETTWELTPLL